MCFLCRPEHYKGSSDIWKMKKWYWKYRTNSIFKRGSLYCEKPWILLMMDIDSHYLDNLGVNVRRE